MKVPSIGTCSSSVPFTVSNLNLEGLHLVHIMLARILESAGGERGNVLEQLKLSKAVCPTHPEGYCLCGRAVKRDADFLLNCPVY